MNTTLNASLQDTKVTHTDLVNDRMLNNNFANAAAKVIQQKAPHIKPRVGIILGSGLSGFSESIHDATHIPYSDLPGFPSVSVQGHGKQLTLGLINNVPVACLQGRAHPYEGPHAFEAIKTYVRTLKLIGCEYLLITNASGSLDETMAPGSIMLVTDHINLQPHNPLIGPNDDEVGPRFYPLDNAYDKSMRNTVIHIAEQESIPLHEGVYIAVTGPHYETAAEIRAFRVLGADAVGMSTVPEVLVATHCGLKTCVFATITNYATGLNLQTPHSHEEVLKTAARASIHLNQLLQKLIEKL